LEVGRLVDEYRLVIHPGEGDFLRGGRELAAGTDTAPGELKQPGFGEKITLPQRKKSRSTNT